VCVCELTCGVVASSGFRGLVGSADITSGLRSFDANLLTDCVMRWRGGLHTHKAFRKHYANIMGFLSVLIGLFLVSRDLIIRSLSSLQIELFDVNILIVSLTLLCSCVSSMILMLFNFELRSSRSMALSKSS